MTEMLSANQQKQIKQDRENLLKWYHANKRDLPWRQSREAYRIWISEVMLQQTTVTAVRPFFEKFITRFKTVHDLAQAKIEEVYEYWAGLGYYSRARNLHKAAQLFAENGFPQTYQELIEYPGLGPYTSRAIASIAFNQPVGVLDGNVIRILSRKYDLALEWWKPSERDQLQKIADALAHSDENADINQALMELGATLCTPKKVMCFQCPWSKSCLSLKNKTIEQRPLKKEKEKFQIWHWHFLIENKKNKIYLEKNLSTPFLKENYLPISFAKQLSAKPEEFSFKHNVTKYEIYVSTTSDKKEFQKLTSKIKQNSTSTKVKMTTPLKPTGLWAELDSISQVNPTSLMKKILKNQKLT